MPPEPVPWDRKELRKHESGGGGGNLGFGVGGGGGGPRWREPPYPHHHPYNHNHHHNNHHGGGAPPRWVPDFRYRQPPGHGKQGNRHVYHDEFGNGFVASRGNAKMVDNESYRAGRYGRNNRENRGGSYRGHSVEISSSSSSIPNNGGSGRPINTTTTSELRSVNDNMPSVPSCISISSRDQSQHKEQHDIINGTGHKLERDKSLDWKPLKWTRAGNLSSSSSKPNPSILKSVSVNVVVPESDETKNVTAIQSPMEDASAPCVAQSEETDSKKKTRLQWGEGLAKYEKKIVDVPDDSCIKNDVAVCDTNLEAVDLFEKSTTRGLAFLECCASPTTPSSLACSSSPSVEEKVVVEAGTVENDSGNLSSSPSVLSQNNHSGGSTVNVEKLDVTSLSQVNLSINELMQCDDDSSNVAMNKLLSLKNEFSKVLESTESEIDQLENEMKSLNSEPEENINKNSACEDYSAASSITLRPATLQLVPFVEDNVSPKDDDQEEEDIDSPGSATSKFVENKSENMQVEDVLTEFSGDDDNNLQLSEGISYELILASNRDIAQRAQQVFDKLLNPSGEYIPSESSCLVINDSLKERFLARKRYLHMKERIMSLKFKMFQHIWKEDTRLLSPKKYRVKSHHKKSDSNLRTLNQKQQHRSLSRSRYPSTASGLIIEPTAEMVNYASKLLSDPKANYPQRDVLKMPAMIFDKQERISSMFISTNGLVEDPCAVEKGRSMMNPWTPQEKKIFLEKLTIFGKDFKMISSFIDHKTTADCIEFYYKNHRSESFEGTKNKTDVSKEAKPSAADTYLVASGKRQKNREANAASLELLGAAAIVASNNNNNNVKNQTFAVSSSCSRTQRVDNDDDDVLLDRLSNDERETVAADVLAGICGSISSEATTNTTMSSCITTSVEDWRYQRVRRQQHQHQQQQPLIDDETSSGESCEEEMDPNIITTDWTDEEKSLFVQAFSSYGRDFAMISSFVRTRSKDQCKLFFGKGRKCLSLDTICPAPGNLVVSDDANGSDVEENAIVESGSLVGVKVDEHISSPPDPDVKPDLNSLEKKEENGGDNIINSVDTATIKPELDFDKTNSGSIGNVVSVQGQKDLVDNSDMEPAQGVGVPDGTSLNLPKVGGGDVINVNVEELKAKPSSAVVEGHEENVKDNQSGNTKSPESQQKKCDMELDSSVRKPREEEKNCVEAPLVARPRISSKRSSKLRDNDSSLLDIEIRDEQRAAKACRTNGHFSGNSDLVSAGILRGYPVPVAVTAIKEMSFQQSVPFRYSGGGGGEISYLKRCSSSSGSSKGVSSSQEESTRPKSGSSSEVGAPPCWSNGGDVKLFGQILSKQTSAAPNRNEVNSEQCNKSDDNNKNVVPPSSMFWKKNGFSSLPDSSTLLAKYPSAFNNYVAPSFNQAVCESSNGLAAATALYRNQEMQMQQQPFTIEMRQRNEIIFSEMQIRNNVAAAAVAAQQQQQSRARGGGGAVSDPVAAIRMHFSNNAQNMMMSREDDTWRSNGHVNGNSNSNGNGKVGR